MECGRMLNISMLDECKMRYFNWEQINSEIEIFNLSKIEKLDYIFNNKNLVIKKPKILIIINNNQLNKNFLYRFLMNFEKLNLDNIDFELLIISNVKNQKDLIEFFKFNEQSNSLYLIFSTVYGKKNIKLTIINEFNLDFISLNFSGYNFIILRNKITQDLLKKTIDSNYFDFYFENLNGIINTYFIGKCSLLGDFKQTSNFLNTEINSEINYLINQELLTVLKPETKSLHNFTMDEFIILVFILNNLKKQIIINYKQNDIKNLRSIDFVIELDKNYCKLIIKEGKLEIDLEKNIIYVSIKYWDFIVKILNFIKRKNESVSKKDLKNYNENSVIIFFNQAFLIDELEELPFDLFFDCFFLESNKKNLVKCCEKCKWITYSHNNLLDVLLKIKDDREYTYISNGCDAIYLKLDMRQDTYPDQFPEYNKPILGYWGSLDNIDYDFIKEIANQNNYLIVLVFTNNNLLNQEFPEINNVFYIESTHSKDNYYSWFDLCLYSVVKNNLTKFLNPEQIWEYRAMNKEIITNLDIETSYIKLKNDMIFDFMDLITFSTIKLDTYESFSENILIKNTKKIIVILPCIPWHIPLFQRPQQLSISFSNQNYLVIYLSNFINEDKLKENMYYRKKNNIWITNDILKIINLPNSFFIFFSTSYFLNLEDAYNIIKKNNSKFIYDYIDHIDPKISGSEASCRLQLLNYNKAIVEGKNDFVTASATKLFNNVKKFINNPILITNGVSNIDYKKLNCINLKFLPINYINFIGKYKKIVGYFGAIAPWLDYNLITKLVNFRPDIGFVMIGMNYLNCVVNLPKKSPNFLYMNSVPYENLPYFANHFSVCFIPFEDGEIAKTTSPLKLFEYFALGKPVITTSFMLECVSYSEVFHGSTYIELSEKIDEALSNINNEEYIRSVKKIAIDNDWNLKAKLLINEIEKN